MEHIKLKNKSDFLGNYNIDKEKFEKSNINWASLTEIYDDYLNFVVELEPVAEYVASILRKEANVHSVRQRIKDPEHLIEKIIRKKLIDPASEYTVSNYKTKITDLVGIRVLHLFKENWKPIHEFVNNKWELHETPKANIREGDDPKLIEEFKEQKFEIVNHKYGYRSLHYIVKTRPYKEDVMVELQVRTIFEEGWSEIDHLIRYPYNMDNEILSYYLVMFNRLAGNADEMGSFVLYLKNSLQKMDEIHVKELNDKDEAIHNLEKKISSLKIDKKEKDALQKTIEDLKKQLYQDKSNSIFLGDNYAAPWFKNNDSKPIIDMAGVSNLFKDNNSLLKLSTSHNNIFGINEKKL